MHHAGIHDWASLTGFHHQPPSPNSDQPPFPLQRQRSTAESATTVSAGASIKRRSRAAAMCRLEGRDRADSHSTMSSAAHPGSSASYYDDCVQHFVDLENGDPWRDPWDGGHGYAKLQDVHMVKFGSLGDGGVIEDLSPKRKAMGLKRQGVVPMRASYVGFDKLGADVLVDVEESDRTIRQAMGHGLVHPYQLASAVQNSYELSAPGKPSTVYQPTTTQSAQPISIDDTNEKELFPPYQWNLPHENQDFTLTPRPRFGKPIPPMPIHSEHKASRLSFSGFRKLDFTLNAREALGWHRTAVSPPEPAAANGKPDLYTKYDMGEVLYDFNLAAAEEKRGHITKDPQNSSRNNGKPWRHVLALALIFFNTLGLALAFGAWMLEYTHYHPILDPKIAVTGLIGSTQLALLFAVPALIAEKLKKQPYSQIIPLFGSLSLFLGLFCTSWCTKLASIWICQGLLAGMGMGMLFAVGVHTATKFYDQRGGKVAQMAILLAVTCAPLGGIFYSFVMSGPLVDAQGGFATRMRILALIVLVLLVPTLLLLGSKGSGISDPAKLKDSGHYDSSGSLCDRLPDLLTLGARILTTLVVAFPYFFLPLYGSTNLHLARSGASNLLLYSLLGTAIGHLLLAAPRYIRQSIIFDMACAAGWILMAVSIWIWRAFPIDHGAVIAVAILYGLGSAGFWSQMFEMLLRLPSEKAQDRDRIVMKAEKIFLVRDLLLPALLAGGLLAGVPITGVLFQDGPSKALVFVGVVLSISAMAMSTSVWMKW